MTVIVKKTATRSQLDKALAKLRQKQKSIDLDKYFGKVNFGVSGLEYQKKMRDEWR